MAFTGIAATLLPAGKTVHKTFGLPVPLFADSSSNIKIQSKEAQYLKETDIFIWDEAPMAPRYALEIMDRTLRDIMNNDLPFGGKIIILGGDFRQLLPIKIHGTRCEIVNLSIKFSSTWKHFVNFSLTENVRVLPKETEFAKFLLDMGDGILNDSNDNIQLPDCCIAPINADIIEDIYGDLIRNKEYNKMAKCAILSARNADVDEINKRVVELLDISEERIYTSTDSTENSGNNDDIDEVLLPEYLNTLSPSSLPPYELRLRPNCIIMLIRNLNINEGLCNGTRLMIIELADHLLKCKILTGDK
ncbi:PREDICTED: ATP-dependent DNA helicase PIF7-like, partial [Vollenhovia emeryi]|uniref:ATP-dependent DNA helicase PIF7-like n=1 Tax=Vollenhovia emeryi TaxID=411798 RepID=UPI0005F4B632